MSTAASVRPSDDFPFDVVVVPHVWISVKDGTRLSARFWKPVEKDTGLPPVLQLPALLEYIPYRKNDFTAVRDSKRHNYLAGFGFVCARVDVRGSGDSEGLLLDEYLAQELSDACDVIAWLAEQPWSNGKVGMFGKSWGAFNALQVAALQPPALKAVIAVAGTHDRYAEDVHYTGGCVQAMGMLPWASTMLGYNARPPNATHIGSDKECLQLWRERLERTPHFAEAWLSHQSRDAFWQHGSVCENWDALRVPVFAVGGWADGYTSFVLRLHERLNRCVPFAGIVGPWAHQYPEEGQPGPIIPFAQESVMWWLRWLGSADLRARVELHTKAWRDIFDEASCEGNNAVHRSLRLFVVDMLKSQVPKWSRTHPPSYAGHWITCNGPAKSPMPVVFLFHGPISRTETSSRRGLLDRSAADADDENCSIMVLAPATSALVGSCMGSWWGFGEPGEAHGDQSPDDDASISFTTRPFGESLDIVGFPRITLRVASDVPVAFLAVRLSIIDADHARSSLVSYGVQNICYRDDPSFSTPKPVGSGEAFDVSFELRPLAIRVSQGQSVRVAVSQQLWPLIWPSAVPSTIRLFLRHCQLHLPIVDNSLLADENPSGDSQRPEISQPRRCESALSPKPSREICWMNDTDVSVHKIVDDSGISFLAGDNEGSGSVFGACETTTYTLALSRDVIPTTLSWSPQVNCEHLLVATIGTSSSSSKPLLAWIRTLSDMASDRDRFAVTHSTVVRVGTRPPSGWSELREACSSSPSRPLLEETSGPAVEEALAAMNGLGVNETLHFFQRFGQFAADRWFV